MVNISLLKATALNYIEDLIATERNRAMAAEALAVRHDVSQPLSTEEKQRVHENIAVVSYEAQTITTAQKQVALGNIGAVGYEAQTITLAQKAQARSNIAAVAYEEQALTAGQQLRVRQNIGVPELASTADAQAGSRNDVLMTPWRVNEQISGRFGVSGAPPLYSPRAWGNFNNGALRAGGNIAAFERHGVGNYYVRFANHMPDANYAVTVNRTAADGGAWVYFAQVVDKSASGFRIITGYVSGTNAGNYNRHTDANDISFLVFR